MWFVHFNAPVAAGWCWAWMLKKFFFGLVLLHHAYYFHRSICMHPFATVQRLVPPHKSLVVRHLSHCTNTTSRPSAQIWKNEIITHEDISDNCASLFQQALLIVEQYDTYVYIQVDLNAHPNVWCCRIIQVWTSYWFRGESKHAIILDGVYVYSPEQWKGFLRTLT